MSNSRLNDYFSQDKRQTCGSYDDICEYERYDGEWYKADIQTPVYKWTGKRFQEGSKLCKYLLEPTEPGMICTAVPQKVAHNTIFLLDLNKLRDRDDWKSDDMGAWKHNGKHDANVALLDDGVIEVVGESVSSSKTIANYKLFKRYYKNKGNQSVRKCVSWLEGNPDLLCIQYVFQDGEMVVKPLPHGNAKHDKKPYTRTKKSTQVHLRETRHSTPTVASQQVTIDDQMGETVRTKESTQVHLRETSHSTPTLASQKVTINDKIDETAGATPISNLPIEKEQPGNLKRKHPDNTNELDSLVWPLVNECKRQLLSTHEELFIQEVVCAPEVRTFLCFKWQIDEIILFCTNPERFSILGANTNFNMGKFNLTVTTYQNLKIVDKDTGDHPIMIGPIFMSETKSYDAYHYFLAKIVGLSEGCAEVIVFGTDGEQQLSKAKHRVFPQAIELRCFNHFRENCIAKLRKSNVPYSEIKLFLDDIFGRKIGDVFQEGLVDCSSEEDLRVKTMLLEETWNERERKYLPAYSRQQPSFYEYFVERIEMMSANMLKDVRVSAGLGDPPSQYFTNIPESANALLKKAAGSNEESEMAAFCSQVEEIIRNQRTDTENAVINKGPYTLAASHQSFQITADKWLSMNARQRELHLKRFHESAVILQEGEMTHAMATDELLTTTGASSAQSVGVMEASILNTQMSLENISSKAKEMLSRPNAVIRAPGCDENSFMVESGTNSRPLFVTHDTKTNKVTCDDCPVWASFNICSHSLAVAEMIGKRRGFLVWHAKMSPSTNLASFVISDKAWGKGE